MVVLGGVSWDLAVALGAFPDPTPHTAFARGHHETVGSTGAGKALNLRRLGFDVALHGVTGDDPSGAAIARALAAAGVDFRRARDPHGTQRHVNLMDAHGGRISIFLTAPAAPADLDLPAIDALIAAADHVVLNIEGYCRDLIPAIQRAGKAIWCDVHDWDDANPYHLDFVAAADYLFLSSDRMPGWRDVMARMVGEGKRLVVCTHGAAGATALAEDGAWHEVAAVPVAAVRDTNGAGDAFFAGYLLGHARGEPVARRLQLGAAVAALCVQSPDLTHPDLDAALADRERTRAFG